MNDDRIKPGELYRIAPDGRWEIYLDATMATNFGLCPALYYESFVLNLTPKGDHPFTRDLGSWWSSCMENIYTAFSKNIKLTPMELVELATREWDRLGMDLYATAHPKAFKEFGGRYGAIQMIAEYAGRQLPIDYRTWKIIAAEASFGRNREVKIGETSRIILYWMGQPDLFVEAEKRILPVDHKSVAAIDDYTEVSYKPNTQIPGYIIAGQVLLRSLNSGLTCDRAIINCVGRKDTTDKSGSDIKRPRFKRFTIHYSEAELEEWRESQLRTAEDIRRSFETGIWQMRPNACKYMWGRKCVMHDIHKRPPETRDIVRISSYIKREPWIPGMKEKNGEEKA